MAQFWFDDFIGIKYYAMNMIKAISHYMIMTERERERDFNKS